MQRSPGTGRGTFIHRSAPRPRRVVLGSLATLPATLLLPGCGTAADALPPLPPGTRPFAENGAWEAMHDQFASDVQRTVRERYGRVGFTGYALPRQISWDDVVRHYDQPLLEAGWRPDEGMSGTLRGGHLRVWSGSWRRAWRGALAIALLERPDPDRLGLGQSFLVGATGGG